MRPRGRGRARRSKYDSFCGARPQRVRSCTRTTSTTWCPVRPRGRPGGQGVRASETWHATLSAIRPIVWPCRRSPALAGYWVLAIHGFTSQPAWTRSECGARLAFRWSLPGEARYPLVAGATRRWRHPLVEGDGGAVDPSRSVAAGEVPPPARPRRRSRRITPQTSRRSQAGRGDPARQPGGIGVLEHPVQGRPPENHNRPGPRMSPNRPSDSPSRRGCMGAAPCPITTSTPLTKRDMPLPGAVG